MDKILILLVLVIVPITGLKAQDHQRSAAAKTMCQATTAAKRNAKTFQQWIDDVWHGGRVDLVNTLVARTYVRHEAKGTRSVTPAQYTGEILAARDSLHDIRFVIHECTATGDRVWTRWTMVGTDSKTGAKVRRMGMQ